MVAYIIQTVTLVILTLSLTSCGFVKSIWGENAPPRKVVVVSNAPLPAFTKVFSDDEDLAVKTLDTWKQSILNSFKQIKGSRPDFITIAEIRTLIRKGFLKLADGDPELSVKRAEGVLRLLGYQDGISSQNVQDLIGWFESNRKQAKSFYRLIREAQSTHTALLSEDVIDILNLLGSFIALGGETPYSASDLNQFLHPWIPDTRIHAKAALESAFELGISFFASLCGDRVENSLWNGKKIGMCLQDMVVHFKSSAPVFDFMFGNLNPIQNRQLLMNANERFAPQVAAWMNGHQHPLFPTARVAKLAEKLNIPAPYAFFKLTEWLPKLNDASTEKAFSPTFFVDLAKISQDWIRVFLEKTKGEACAIEGYPGIHWKDCLFNGSFEPAEKLFNDEYATLIRNKNLDYINKIAMYDSVSGFLIQKISDQSITDLITIMVRLLDSNAFAFNVINRIQEKPIDTSSLEVSLKSVHREGLGQLAALASELIPERGKYRRGFLKQLRAHLYDPAMQPIHQVDRLGITAFLYLYDLMTSMRAEYLRHFDLPIETQGPLHFVKRKKIVEAMPKILFDHFPRIYNECLEWGFERTCGVIYTEVLPSTPQGRDDLETYEVDIITLTSILLESMMNRCDRNGNDVLSNNLFDGYDEKHCMLNMASLLASRLMNANIVKNDETTKLLMTLMKRVPFLRWVAKVGLSRGSMKGGGMIVRSLPPFSMFSGKATLGSVLSLAAEFMDAEKTKAIDQGVLGHHEDPGDEWIYLDRMSTSLLPSKELAERTSERAKLRAAAMADDSDED